MTTDAVPVSETTPVLEVAGLEVAWRTDAGWTSVVDDVGFAVAPGRTHGLVGESGCGKSTTGLAVMGLLPRGSARVVRGVIRLRGRDLAALDERAMSDLRGNDLAMVFQEPASSLDPAFTIGDQIAESVCRHTGASRRQARARAVEMLALVGIPAPHRRADEYPHTFSGGMRQRATIAMAVVNDPTVLIADEPTTALDTTTQAQILALLMDLQAQLGMATVLITHDFGVVADVCDRVTVMYAGQVVESATTGEIFDHPGHPYTAATLALLSAQQTVGPLRPIPGTVPPPTGYPSGCRFHPRCAYRQRPACVEAPVPLAAYGPDHLTRCARVGDLALAGVAAPDGTER